MLGSRRDPKPPTATGQLSYRVPPPVTSHGAVSQSSSGDWMTTRRYYWSYLISHLSEVQSNTFSHASQPNTYSRRIPVPTLLPYSYILLLSFTSTWYRTVSCRCSESPPGASPVARRYKSRSPTCTSLSLSLSLLEPTSCH